MIGFGHQSAKRRPIYSDATGEKLYYVVSGPDGEWLTSLDGKRIGRIKKVKRTRAKDVSASLSGTYITPGEIEE